MRLYQSPRVLTGMKTANMKREWPRFSDMKLACGRIVLELIPISSSMEAQAQLEHVLFMVAFSGWQ